MGDIILSCLAGAVFAATLRFDPLDVVATAAVAGIVCGVSQIAMAVRS
jgi:hypothetical protein